MEIKTNKSSLLAALKSASKAIPAKAVIPVMEDFRVAAADGRLTVTATDGQMTIVVTTDAEGEGTFLANAKMLLDSVALLPDGDITLTIDNPTLTIDYGHGKFTIPTFPVEDYPDVTFADPVAATSFNPDVLKAALAYVLPSVAKDQLRPVLCGVYFGPADNGYDIVATDSHTLSLQTVECEVTTGPVIIPTNAATFLKDNIKEQVLFSEDDNKAIFNLGDIVMSVVKVVGNYPKYNSVMPKNNENKLTAPVGELLGAVKRVATCANKASNAVKLSLTTLGGASLEAQDLGFGCAAREDMDFIAYNGEDLTIGFKHDLLTALLGVVDEDEVTMSFSNSRGAALVTSSNESRKALIMPVAVA